jgi:uncharacterized protein
MRVDSSITAERRSLMVTAILLTAAGFLGGTVNVLAGGGTLVTFPALLFAGLNPIDANASSVVALFPGTFASVWAYRRSIFAITEVNVIGLLVVSLSGGIVGALLLLYTPTPLFAGLVPWLVLSSTIIFAIGNFAPFGMVQRVKFGPRTAMGTHLIISIYGGYFGGGIGFLMLAALTLFGVRDINTMNGLKMALVGVMTFTAIMVFVLADVVHWPQVLPMFISSAIGGYVAARVAQRLDQRLLKGFIVLLGAGLTAFFFWSGV